MSDLFWQHTLPEGGPDFVLLRTRTGEPETIGRVMASWQSSVADVYEGWTWTLTSQARPLGVLHPNYLTSGFEETQRGARDALVATWRREEAFRAEARESEAFAGMSPYMRSFLTHGQPVPPGRVAQRGAPAPGIVLAEPHEDDAAEARWMSQAVALIQAGKHDIEWDAALERYRIDGMPVTSGQVVELAMTLGKAPL